MLRILKDGDADVKYAHPVRNFFLILTELAQHRTVLFSPFSICDAQHTGWSALHGTASQGHVSVALALLDFGSDISATSAVRQRTMS